MNIQLTFGLSVCFLSTSLFPVKAQIVEDNTLSTEVNTDNNRDFIVEAGEQRGNNLFHSFREFSVPNNGSVFFDNAVTIQNIITRVTGSSISEINGLIQSNGAANLFLLNSNGIIFGENAKLDIGGSFIGTTAESLLFEDGTEFSTNPNNSEPLLTVNVPLGLQFGSNAGEIINRANFSIPNPLDPTGQDQIKQGLTVNPNQTLALIGNGITFDGGAATAPTGNIELGSVADNSLVTLEPTAKGWQANYADVSQFQDLVFDNLASVDASGVGGGDINVWGKNIRILNGSAITSNTLGDLDGGTIQIQASDLLEINGSDITGTKFDPLLAGLEIFFPFVSQISTNTFGSGNGGDVNIVAQNLKLIDGAAIELQTFLDSQGQSGNLSILVADSIELSGNRKLIGIGENAEDLVDPSLGLETAIEINLPSEIQVLLLSDADGGNINIKSSNISLQDGARIATSPFDSGDGGNIEIEASDSIEIVGTTSRVGDVGSSITASTFADGNAGNVTINTMKLTVEDGGLVISTTGTSGNAGNINIDASEIEISGFRSFDQVPSFISAQTDNGGNGGDISINTDELLISDRASLSVTGTGNSVPGNINVDAEFVELRNGGNISASTEFQSGGNITLDIAENLTLQENSLISAQAFNAANGGNLDIDVNFIIALPQQNNDILASAVFGDGGNITISGEGIFGIEERSSQPPNLTNDLDASSEFGTSGAVTLIFPIFTGVDGLFRLPPDFINARELFNNNFCNISEDSSFTVSGRGGIPDEIDQDFFAPKNWSDWRMVEEDTAMETTEEITAVVEPEQTATQLALIQGWVKDAQGNILLTDKPVAGSAHNPGLNSLDCNQVQFASEAKDQR